MKEKKIEALWSHLYSLSILADAGSFTAAAGRLGLSKAAMSHRIGELELAAATPLVRRTTRSVRLTEAGQRMVGAMRGPFTEIERSFASLKDLASEPQGLLRLTVPVALGRQQIVPLVSEFLREFPAIRIELELSDRLSSLAKDGFDLAIRHVAAVPETHIAWNLCRTASLIVASGSYLRRRGSPRAPAELRDHNCLHYLRSSVVPTWTMERRKNADERVTVQISGSFAANNSEALRHAAMAGLGIALVPDFSVYRDIRAGKLKVVLPDWHNVGAFGQSLFAISPYSPYVPRNVRTFVDFLRGKLSNGFDPTHTKNMI